MGRGRSQSAARPRKPKLVRFPPDMADQLTAVAWFSRRPTGDLVESLCGEALRREYEKIPKDIRDRLVAELSQPAPAA